LKKFIRIFLSLIVFTFALVSCTPPRAIQHSGKVTPHKQLTVGANFTANLTSHFARSLYKNVESIAQPLVNKDTLNISEQIIFLNKTALAYAIDPFGVGYDFYARYGLTPAVDMGYKLASGTHVLDARYQFMGSKGSISEPQQGLTHGSIGIQYSYKNYSLPEWSGLKLAQKILDFNLKRKDLIVPLVFSLAFGPEETYGSLATGIVYSHTFFNYGFENTRIYDTLNSISPVIVSAIHGKQNFGAMGAFLNLKLGYKFIYIIPAAALYYQNYKSYNLIDGTKAPFKGFSFVPSIGFQLNPTEISNAIKKKDKPQFSN